MALGKRTTLAALAPYIAVVVFWCVLKNGWLAILAYHAQLYGRRLHFASTSDTLYVDGKGRRHEFGPVEASHAYVVTKEAGRCVLTPAPFRESETVVVRPNHLGIEKELSVAVDAATPSYSLTDAQKH